MSIMNGPIIGTADTHGDRILTLYVTENYGENRSGLRKRRGIPIYAALAM